MADLEFNSTFNWDHCRSLVSGIQVSKDVNELLINASEILKTTIGLEQCAIYVQDAEQSELEGLDKFKNEVVNATGIELKVVEEIIRDKQPKSLEPAGIVIPIKSKDKCTGLMLLKQGEVSLSENQENVNLVLAFADYLGSQLSNFKMARHLNQVENQLVDLQERNKQLEELDQVRTQIINTVSHELRTPLVSIMGFSNMLRRHELTEELIQESSDQIYAAGQRLSRMIDDFILLNRAENRGWEVNVEPLDVGQMAHYVVNEFAPIHKRHNFNFDFPNDYPLIKGDRRLLRQVLENLVVNAIKYSPKGGDITLKITLIDERLEVSIADEGIGMEPDEANRIFERFYRIKSKHTEAIGGIGLGLAICRDIVTALGGSIRCSSNLGKGSIFTVSLLTHEGALPEISDEIEIKTSK